MRRHWPILIPPQNSLNSLPNLSRRSSLLNYIRTPYSLWTWNRKKNWILYQTIDPLIIGEVPSLWALWQFAAMWANWRFLVGFRDWSNISWPWLVCTISEKPCPTKKQWKHYGCLIWFALLHAQAAQPHQKQKGKITAWHILLGLIGLLSLLPGQINLRQSGLPTSATRIRHGRRRASNFGLLHEPSFFSTSQEIFKFSLKSSFCLWSEYNDVSIRGLKYYLW